MEQNLKREQCAADLLREGIPRTSVVNTISNRFKVSIRTARRIVLAAEQALGSEFMSTGAPVVDTSERIDCLAEAKKLLARVTAAGDEANTLAVLRFIHKLQVEHDIADGARQFETQWADELKPF